MKNKDSLFHHSAWVSLLILTLIVFRPDFAACAAPTLDWVGYYGLWNDGVTPDYGTTPTTFTFKVIYTDSDGDYGDAPYTGYPKVHILKGGTEIGSYTMTQDSCAGGDCDGNYKNGERYYYTTNLDTTGIYTYYFEAKDSNEDIAGFSSPTNEHTFTVVTDYIWVDYDVGYDPDPDLEPGVTCGKTTFDYAYCKTITKGISMASAGEAVRVRPVDNPPYEYQESFTMADGVHVVSNNSDNGDSEATYDDPYSDYQTSMLTRTGRTIIQGGITFPSTLTADVVLDGFTVYKNIGGNTVIDDVGKSPIIKNNIIRWGTGSATSCLEVGGTSLTDAPIVENNLIHHISSRGISVSSYVNPIIQDNEIWDTGAYPGIGINRKGVTGGVITILNNHIFDCGGPGIGSKNLAKLLTVIIQGNDIHDNGFDTSSAAEPRGAGIYLKRAFASGGTLEITIGGPDPDQGNEIYNNCLAGIRLDGSDMSFNPVLIQNNTIHDNGTAGMQLVDVGYSYQPSGPGPPPVQLTWATILDNDIYGHTYAGINIGGATYADIMNNEINGNYLGIAFRVDYFNSYCIDVDVPYDCCTGPGTGNCTSFNSYCVGLYDPYDCCTGANTGTCDIIDNSDCTGSQTPYPCCTGPGTGTCNFIDDPDKPSSGMVYIGGTGYNSDCTASVTPYPCCTGVGTGTCNTPHNYECKASGDPYPCCTGLGTGTCNLLETNNIYSNTMAGIAVRDAITGEVTIAGNDLYQNDRAGICIVNGCNLVINRNDIHDNIRGGIHTGSDVADDYFGDADSDCTAFEEPYPCCTGLGTGTCYSSEGFIGPADSAFLDVSQNKVYHNGLNSYGGGVDIRHASGSIINNLIYENRKGGIRFGDYISEIVNNTVVDNGHVVDETEEYGGGICYDDLDGAVNDTAGGYPLFSIPIRNNITAFNVLAGIRVRMPDNSCDTTGTYRDYNLIYGNKGQTTRQRPQLYKCSGNANEIFALPQFVDRDNDDYRLDPGPPASPAVDAGDTSYGTDVSLPPGVGTSIVDMGAYGGPDGLDW